MVEIKTCLNSTIDKLLEAGVENADFEARQLIMHTCGKTRNDFILKETSVDEKDMETLEIAVRKRCEHYPLQYILGEWEFYGLTFNVGEGVLIPRQDTEVLCEIVLTQIKGAQNKKIIDLCSGSGCIAITLDKYSDYKNNIYALEKSDKAIEFLEINTKSHNSEVQLIKDDVLAPNTDEWGFDIIVSNPPYLSFEDMQNLQTEVSFEPKMALEATDNGLHFYENITKIWTERLKPKGLLIYEIGINQQDDVKKILGNYGYENIREYKDLCGIIRVVSGYKK